MNNILDKIEHSKRMRRMAEEAYMDSYDDKQDSSVLGDIVENITQMVLDLIEVEIEKTFTLDEQEKIIQNILMRVYDNFVLLTREKNVVDKKAFAFEKYGVKLYLLFRNAKSFDFSKDKDFNVKLTKEKIHLWKLFF